MTSVPTNDALARLILTGSEDVVEARIVEGRVNRQIMYWRACPSRLHPNCEQHKNNQDFIIMGPAMSRYTSQEYSDFIDVKHAEPLTQYGSQEAGDMWKAETRFGQIIAKGGLKEFSIQQMVDLGWHELPGVLAARPELKGAVTLLCPQKCARRKFYGITLEQAQGSLTKHMAVMHRDTVGPAAIGAEMAKAISQIMNGGQLPQVQTSQQFSLEDLANVIALAMKQNSTTTDVEPDPQPVISKKV